MTPLQVLEAAVQKMCTLNVDTYYCRAQPMISCGTLYVDCRHDKDLISVGFSEKMVFVSKSKERDALVERLLAHAELCRKQQESERCDAMIKGIAKLKP